MRTQSDIHNAVVQKAVREIYGPAFKTPGCKPADLMVIAESLSLAACEIIREAWGADQETVDSMLTIMVESVKRRSAELRAK